MKRCLCLFACAMSLAWCAGGNAWGDDPEAAPELVKIWPGLAPGESTQEPGEALPRRANESPPATRIAGITLPQLEVYRPTPDATPSIAGAAVLILPGGGYNYVVRDKEGSEPAQWLNKHGITAFVLRYRTKPKTPRDEPLYLRPWQDTQRALSLIRSRAADWKLDPNQLGIMGFSAGGQTAAIATAQFDRRTYERIDATDDVSCRPDFSLLIYPWQLWDAKSNALIEPLRITARTPPTFLVHTHDDSSTSLGSVLFYAELKRQRVPGELHVYRSGGHGYGLRPVSGSVIGTWIDRADDWLDGTLPEALQRRPASKPH